jgi:hypothetical protein
MLSEMKVPSKGKGINDEDRCISTIFIQGSMEPMIQRCPVVVRDLRQVLGCKYGANSEFPSAELSNVSLQSSVPLGLQLSFLTEYCPA